MTQSDGTTVLICTWNRSALLRETLASLGAMHVPSTVRWEVLIVDNNSTDATRDVVEQARRTFPVPVRYRFEKRQGKLVQLRAGQALMLFDLLSPEEEADRANVFDIPLLAGRLGAATAWLLDQDDTRALPIGFFGASTGAGAALWAAAEPDSPVRAIVSRGGRPTWPAPGSNPCARPRS